MFDWKDVGCIFVLFFVLFLILIFLVVMVLGGFKILGELCVLFFGILD